MTCEALRGSAMTTVRLRSQVVGKEQRLWSAGAESAVRRTATPLWLTHADAASYTSDARKPKRRRRPAHAGLCRRTPKRRAARAVSVAGEARFVTQRHRR